MNKFNFQKNNHNSTIERITTDQELVWNLANPEYSQSESIKLNFNFFLP